MTKVLRLDCNFGGTGVEADLGSETTEVWVTCDVALSANALTWLNSQNFAALFQSVFDAGGSDGFQLVVLPTFIGSGFGWNDTNTAFGDFFDTLAPLQFYTLEMHCTQGSPSLLSIYLNGTSFGTLATSVNLTGFQHYQLDSISGGAASAGSYVYLGYFNVGTTRGGTDVFSDDFQGSLPGSWGETYNASVASLVTDPGIAPPEPAPGPGTTGRVMIAFDDGPLVATPAWTVIDQGGVQGGATIPYDFVSGYDTHSGRQTLIAQTETGTATVYCNDRSGLLDDRNMSSPFQGKLSGRQILLQLYNPVTTAWEPQFRGLIDDYRYTIDGSAVGADGNPVNCDIQIDCVDMFDYLNGYGLTPGIDGVTPPTGAEDSVYYPASGVGDFVADRILEILTDANIDPAMSSLSSGNVQVVATQYNADESALTALRDAADAELPFIGNIYINRSGLFCFRGRYSRFNPDAVKAAGGGTWDFTRWPVGDGKAIQTDPTRAQIRLLSYSKDRADLVNAALCYPMATKAASIPGQVYANTASITAYGKHQLSPISDLITAQYVGPGTITPDTGLAQCALYAELLVKNKKDPRICPTAVQLKSINPTDFRASATWGVLTQSDIGHIVNIAVGYPGGTGLAGGATVDDYYIEGRALTVRPANTSYDYVELDLEVTPFVWSADTHGVFPPFSP